MSHTVVLTDAEIKEKLLKNHQALQRFSFLQPAKVRMDALGGCSHCQAKAKTQAFDAAMTDVKRHLAKSLSETDKADLKLLLGASSVRVYYTEQRGENLVRDFATL